MPCTVYWSNMCRHCDGTKMQKPVTHMSNVHNKHVHFVVKPRRLFHYTVLCAVQPCTVYSEIINVMYIHVHHKLFALYSHVHLINNLCNVSKASNIEIVFQPNQGFQRNYKLLRAINGDKLKANFEVSKLHFPVVRNYFTSSTS